MIISVLLAVIEIAIIVFIVRGFLNRQAANQARCLVNMLCNTDKLTADLAAENNRRNSTDRL